MCYFTLPNHFYTFFAERQFKTVINAHMKMHPYDLVLFGRHPLVIKQTEIPPSMEKHFCVVLHEGNLRINGSVPIN